MNSFLQKANKLSALKRVLRMNLRDVLTADAQGKQKGTTTGAETEASAAEIVGNQGRASALLFLILIKHRYQ
jgi:hypothetical protein